MPRWERRRPWGEVADEDFAMGSNSTAEVGAETPAHTTGRRRRPYAKVVPGAVLRDTLASMKRWRKLVSNVGLGPSILAVAVMGGFSWISIGYGLNTGKPWAALAFVGAATAAWLARGLLVANPGPSAKWLTRFGNVILVGAMLASLARGKVATAWLTDMVIVTTFAAAIGGYTSAFVGLFSDPDVVRTD